MILKLIYNDFKINSLTLNFKTSQFTQGIQLNRPYLSEYMIRDKASNCVLLRYPRVLLVNGTISKIR
jgi:chaperonin GroEL (HSP60 family)